MRKSDRENGEEARAIRCVLEPDYSLAPLLGQGETGPQATAGVVRTVGKGQISGGIEVTLFTAVALRDRRREAGFEGTTSRKGGSRRRLVFRLKACS